MSQKSIILVVTLFALLIVGMFIYAHLKQSEIKDIDNTKENTEVQFEAVLYPDITRIDAKHYFVNDTHTLVGEINFPTLCDLLEVNSEIEESYPEQVMLNFNVINNSENCVQMITAQRFKIDLEVSQKASFQAKFLGRTVELNLIPAAEGELPDDFELFIKG